MTTTTSHIGLCSAKYRSESIMGVTQDDGDNAIDATYSIKPDQEGVTTLNAITTTRVLKPIINNTVRPI